MPGTGPFPIGCLLLVWLGVTPARSQSVLPPVSRPPEAELLTLAEAEEARGIYVSYRQSFVDQEKARARYHGSVYSALQSLKLEGCVLKIETTTVDNFSGTVGRAETGEQQDSYTYSVTFRLTREGADAMMQVRARPAPLGAHTNTVCAENPSCAFSWLRMQTSRRDMEQITTLNHFVIYSGHVDHFLIPLSSPEAGNQLMGELRTMADSRCQ